MKKRFLLFSALLSLLLLTGCTKQLTDKPLTLSFSEETAAFTGTLSKGTYTGTVLGDGWQFEGTLTAECLLTGEGENVPCRAALFGSVEDGTYTGSLVSGMPDGEGVFTLASGASFTGEFSGGTAVRGEAADLPWTLLHGGSRFSGTYTGPLESAGPEGEGLFGGENAAGQQFTWHGGWSGGETAGPGVLTDEHCIVSVEGRETAGSYAGDGCDGLPDGEGVFTGESETGVPFTYTGEWSAGLMDGKGTLSYDAENLYTRTGTFTAGALRRTGLRRSSLSAPASRNSHSRKTSSPSFARPPIFGSARTIRIFSTPLMRRCGPKTFRSRSVFRTIPSARSRTGWRSTLCASSRRAPALSSPAARR